MKIACLAQFPNVKAQIHPGIALRAQTAALQARTIRWTQRWRFTNSDTAAVPRDTRCPCNPTSLVTASLACNVVADPKCVWRRTDPTFKNNEGVWHNVEPILGTDQQVEAAWYPPTWIGPICELFVTLLEAVKYRHLGSWENGLATKAMSREGAVCWPIQLLPDKSNSRQGYCRLKPYRRQALDCPFHHRAKYHWQCVGSM